MPRLYATLVFLLSGLFANATQIRGTVLDEKTKEPLIGATVLIKGTNVGTSVSLSGSFKLSLSSPGTYILVCSYVSYESIEKAITISSQEKMNVDFELRENASLLNEIVVKGVLDKTSDEFALHTEKNSQSIINVMSAKTIQLMPDITVANLLQRFSGVSVDRSSSGDAQYAIIRGMPQRYSYTLVNGIKIPSPDNKNRYVPMDLFPSDLLDRLEVIKTLTPSMEGDATGGAMNLVMKDAPSEFTVTANIGTGTNMNAVQNGFSTYTGWQTKAPVQTHSPGYVASSTDFSYKNFDYHNVAPVNQIYGFSIGDRLTKDKRLGAIFAGSLQDVYRSTSTVFFAPDNETGPNNLPEFDDYYVRQYSLHQKRTGLHFKSDYRMNEKNKFKLYAMFVNLNEIQRRHTIDTSLSVGRNGPGTGNVYLLNRSKVQNQNIFNVTLQGDNVLKDFLKVNWSAVYSQATNDVPDWSEYSTSQQVGYKNVILTPQALYTPFNRQWLSNSDTDYSGYLNFLYSKKIENGNLEISAGGLYHDRARNNTYYYYDLVPMTSGGRPLSFLEGRTALTASQWQFNGANAAMGNIVNPNTYVAHERISAGYLQGNVFLANKLEIIGGVRVEHTLLDYKTPLSPVVVPGAYGTLTYLDILPSVNFKYKLSPNQNLRGSYYKSLNRQGFFELPPTLIKGDNFNEAGNPYLKHVTIDNADLRYEQFTRALNQIFIGVFYKNLTNPIETVWGASGTSSQTISPRNVSNATNFGFELALTQYWGRFGVSGNYTFTQSQLTTTKLFTEANFHADSVKQTRPLQGQAKNIGNLSFLYKDVDRGLNLQLAFAYTGTRIALVSPYQNVDYWQQPYLTMDFSVEKKFMKYFSFYLKIQNILNSPYLVDINHPNIYISGHSAIPDQTNSSKILVQREYYGQNFIGGIRYKFSK